MLPNIFRRSTCNSVQSCLETGDKWYWKGSDSAPDIRLHPLDANGVQILTINSTTDQECVMQTDKNKLEDFPCTDAAKKVCILTNGGRGIGSSIGKIPLSNINLFLVELSVIKLYV